MLSMRSGVPVASISRLERTGQGSIESFFRLLHAMGDLDVFDAWVAERIRLAMIPLDLRDMPPSHVHPRQRVRSKRNRAAIQ
jgi:hypothetical protein